MINLNNRLNRGTRALSFRAAILVLLALWMRPASASLPTSLSVLDMVRQADVILIGTPGKIQDGKAQFSVEQVLKGGNVAPVIEVAPVTNRPHAMNARHFQEGAILMLFLERRGSFTIAKAGNGFLAMNPATRIDTVAAVQHLLTLPRSGDDVLMRAMLTLATSDNALLRREAHLHIRTAGFLRPQKQPLLYEKELIALLQHPDSDVRIAALQGLRFTRSEKVLPLVIERSREHDISVVKAASMALAPYDTAESVAALVALTRHADSEIRIHALLALDDSRNPQAKASHIALLDDSDPKVRAFAPRGLVRWLRRGEAAEVIPRLIVMLDDSVPDAQVRAAAALRESANATAVGPLFGVLGREELSEAMEEEAMSALNRIYSRLDAPSRPPLGGNLARVVTVMERGRWGAGREAAGLLGRIATPEALDTLRWAADHYAVPGMRQHAEKLLHLAIIENRLREIVLEAHPEATINLSDQWLMVRYQSEKYRTHIIDAHGNTSKQPADQFPDDFSEFLLHLNVERDVMYYRPGQYPVHWPQTFGSTLSQRYNLKEIPAVDPAGQNPEVPHENWAYIEYDKLSAAGLVRKLYPEGMYSGPPIVMTRYEFAVAIARYLQDGALSPTAKSPTGDRELSEALTALQHEFAPEISAFEPDDDHGLNAGSPKPVVHGQKWQPRYQHLSLRISYGRGMDPALLEKIQQAIHNYASASFKSSVAAANAPLQP